MTGMRRSLGSILFVMVAAVGLGPLVAVVSSPAGGQSALTGERPYGLKVPQGYDGQRPVPLVVLLHGYTSSGPAQDAYFRLSAQADRGGFLLAYPDGTRDASGNRFWNATDACCDFYGAGVDDVAYLDAVIDEISGRYRVDPARVFLVGHSNGAFMAHRYACDRAGRVAAIVALAGLQWKDPGRCGARSAVSVLHVHGQMDQTIHYQGGSTLEGTYPGAVDTVGTWAAKDGCFGSLTSTGWRLDIEARLPGEETAVDRYGGCPAGVDVELWTIEGGTHIPAFNEHWAEAIWAFMARHAKAGSLAAG
jgi:polyhydroxybutyrate depolymerase